MIYHNGGGKSAINRADCRPFVLEVEEAALEEKRFKIKVIYALIDCTG